MQYKLKIITSNSDSLTVLEAFLKKLAPLFKRVVLPTKRKRFVFLKSPHVNKKSKEHFQLLKYSRLYYTDFKTAVLLKNFISATPNDLKLVLKRSI